jgi:hypothetical protein
MITFNFLPAKAQKAKKDTQYGTQSVLRENRQRGGHSTRHAGRVEKIQTKQWEPHKRLLHGMKDEGA